MVLPQGSTWNLISSDLGQGFGRVRERIVEQSPHLKRCCCACGPARRPKRSSSSAGLQTGLRSLHIPTDYVFCQQGKAFLPEACRQSDQFSILQPE